MAVYEYRREDGTTFEVRQKMSDPPLTECPDTGQPVERLIGAPGISLVGHGWHRSDYDSHGPKPQRKRDLGATYRLSKKDRKAAARSNIPKRD